MEQSQPIKSEVNQSDLGDKKLGQITISRDAFDLDLKINEGYQNYSAELLRLALLILTGLAAVWLKLYLPDKNQAGAGSHADVPPLFFSITFLCSFAATVVAAGAALLHRYTAADSLAYHLTSLRRRERNRPARGSQPSDVTIADKQDKARDKRFQWSGDLLKMSVGFLFGGLVLFAASLACLMFLH